MQQENGKHEILEQILKNSPNLDKELLARSLELAEVLKTNGMRPHGYTLERPSEIRRVRPLVQSASERQYSGR